MSDEDTAIILSTQHIELYDKVKLIVVVEGDGGRGVVTAKMHIMTTCCEDN